MSGRLQDKRCAVTGASAGIGAAIARHFAAEGAAVIGLARRFPSRTVEPRAGAICEVAADVRCAEDVDRVFGELGERGVDVLVNGAGVGLFGSFESLRPEQLSEMLEVHVVGTFLCARAALVSMKARGAGHIVNLISIAAVQTFADCAGYSAAKAGQLALSRALAEEVRGAGVRVTALLPGATDTAIWDGRPGFDRNRMMRPEDLARLAVELVALPPALGVDEVLVRPPAGTL